MTAYLRRFGRPWIALAIAGILAAAVLAFVPLFDLVGYESAAFFGVLFGFASSYLTPADLSVNGWARSLGRNWLLLVAPFVMLTLNALRVRNCDYMLGVAFWLVIPVVSIALGTTLRWAVGNVVASRRLVWAIVTLVGLATLADLGLRLALEPPIVGFHWYLGYFSGSIYDEALGLPNSLLAYRRIHLLGIAAVVCLVGAWRRRDEGARAVRWMAVCGALLAVGTGYLFATRSQWGIDLDRDAIAEALGGVVETKHFIIHYPAQREWRDDVTRLAHDHEFRYSEMKAYFGTDPVAFDHHKIESFVYPDQATKGRLMGGRRTLVAKLWLGEIHVLWRYYGDHMLAHELAHVFTAPFGTGPLRLSTRWGVGVNMGLVEGAATAADWNVADLDLHHASAALRKMHRAPDLTRLVGASGFWTQSSGRAYTLMGSFVRWLVHRYGMAKFRRAYGHGDFESAYGVSGAKLVAEWGKFVDALPLTKSQMQRARYLYDRKSIFQKVCARTIAELRLRAHEKGGAGDERAALEIYREILAFDPHNVDYRLDYAGFLRSLGRRKQARQELQRLLKAPDLDAVHRARALAMLGDLLWLAGDVHDASSRYGECLGVGLPVQLERFLRVKSRALELDPSQRTLARKYLVDDDVDDSVRLFFPDEWVRSHPDQPLAAYLVGRRLWAAHQWDWAEPLLRRALGVRAPVLRDEANLMLVQTEVFNGHLDRASAVIADWKPSDAHYAERRREWTTRIAWRRRNTISTGGR